jgi:hypothetical protein
VPGTAFASEVAAAVGAGGDRDVRLTDDPVERRRLADAFDACRDVTVSSADRFPLSGEGNAGQIPK